eukprot:scaffold29655_cov118-Isochrysis_galbana.AAC.4
MTASTARAKARTTAPATRPLPAARVSWPKLGVASDGAAGGGDGAGTMTSTTCAGATSWMATRSRVDISVASSEARMATTPAAAVKASVPSNPSTRIVATTRTLAAVTIRSIVSGDTPTSSPRAILYAVWLKSSTLLAMASVASTGRDGGGGGGGEAGEGDGRGFWGGRGGGIGGCGDVGGSRGGGNDGGGNGGGGGGGDGGGGDGGEGGGEG